MIAEYFVLGVKAEVPVQLSVYLMIFGAAMAASNDLSFHLGRDHSLSKRRRGPAIILRRSASPDPPVGTHGPQ